MNCTLSCARSFRARSERLEDRILLAGDCCVGIANDSLGVAAFFASSNPNDEGDSPTTLAPELRTLSGAHSDELAELRERFRLDGTGQTVAVIDSGIAFDHEALGGGYGPDYRVVGGWDFTEPFDRSPYDDAPVGLHGTHVAGIIGSSDGRYSGVAPGVDFVALRVFDDRGYSRLDWLEAALQWVHENQTSFEHPITTVNLSVRFDDSVSDDQLLRIEDELKALYDDNIFVAVAAGNDFSRRDPLEVGNPASSPSVVPVGSVNSANKISTFSQRNERILAAPGESITSTAPDHIENVNGRTDDFYTITGTSMAAPYVAAASVLVRQAMQRVGRVNVSQEDIYDHLRDTADLVHDPVTGLKIPAINIDRAIDTLIDEDLPVSSSPAFKSTPSTGRNDFADARDLGTVDFTTADLGSGEHDLRFKTSQSGTLTVIAEQSRAKIRIYDAGSGRVLADTQQGRLDLQVEQGVELVVHVELIADATIRIANLIVESGAAVHVSGSNQADRVTVSDDVVAINGVEYPVSRDVHSIHLMQSIGRDELDVTSTGNADVGINGLHVNEVGRTISSGTFEQVTVRHSGSDGGVVNMTGTGGDDIVGVSSERTVLRGGRFRFTAQGFTSHAVDGNNGRRDRIRFEGTSGNDRAFGTVEELTFASPTMDVTASGFDQITIEASGGADTANVIGGVDNSSVYTSPGYVRHAEPGKSLFLHDFENVAIKGNGNSDVARMIGSESSDTFDYTEAGFEFQSPGFQFAGSGFETLSVYGRAGDDQSTIQGTAEPDRVDMSSNSVTMESRSVYVAVRQFEFNTVASDRRGDDRIYFEDSSSDDMFLATPDFSRMSAAGYQNIGRGFASTSATARNGGDDRASLFDSSRDDSMFSGLSKSFMIGEGFRNEIDGFNRVTIRASQGYDRAIVNAVGGQSLNGERNRLSVFMSPASPAASTLIGFDQIQATVDSETKIDVANVDYMFSLLNE